VRALFTSILCLVGLAAQAAEETTYHNPVDNKDYKAKWRDYTAKPSGTPVPEGKVKMGKVRLLAEQALFDQNTSARDRVSAAVPKTAPAFELLLQITLTAKARPKIDMSSKGDAPQKLLQTIYDSLAKTPDLRSKKDALPFQIQFIIRDKP
jgi:hypothetical protein